MKNFKWNIELVLLLMLLTYILGMLVSSIGEIPKCATEPYGYGLIFTFVIMFGAASILAFLGGRNSKS